MALNLAQPNSGLKNRYSCGAAGTFHLPGILETPDAAQQFLGWHRYFQIEE
jgi:hypothetical protein